MADKETLIRETIYECDDDSLAGYFVGVDSDNDDYDPDDIEVARQKEEEENLAYCKEVYYKAIAEVSKPKDPRTHCGCLYTQLTIFHAGSKKEEYRIFTL